MYNLQMKKQTGRAGRTVWITIVRHDSIGALLASLSEHDDEPGQWRIIRGWNGKVLADNAPRQAVVERPEFPAYIGSDGQEHGEY